MIGMWNDEFRNNLCAVNNINLNSLVNSVAAVLEAKRVSREIETSAVSVAVSGGNSRRRSFVDDIATSSTSGLLGPERAGENKNVGISLSAVPFEDRSEISLEEYLMRDVVVKGVVRKEKNLNK